MTKMNILKSNDSKTILIKANYIREWHKHKLNHEKHEKETKQMDYTCPRINETLKTIIGMYCDL
jgi:hypothetical protein